MKVKLLIIGLAILTFSCENSYFVETDPENPVHKPNQKFEAFEDLTNPGFSHLIEKYQLDTIFHGETDEFKRILLLRHWIKSVIRIDDHSPHYSGEGFAEGILDAALEGEGYHCGHFMTVQNGIMNAYGYVTRCLGAGPGVQGQEGSDGHHGINEIWLNQYNKWFLSDAKYDHHFEKNGIPLSSLEVRDEYLKNKAADIIKVKGPDRIPTDIDPETGTSWELSARTYTWITWMGNGDYFSVWPDHTGMVFLYEDDFARENVWVRDGNPCWIYDHPDDVEWITQREVIEWTPNTIASEVQIEGSEAVIKLNSDTPNLKGYQVRVSPSGEWQQVDETARFKLGKEKLELTFRVVNLASVSGPEHGVYISPGKPNN